MHDKRRGLFFIDYILPEGKKLSEEEIRILKTFDYTFDASPGQKLNTGYKGVTNPISESDLDFLKRVYAELRNIAEITSIVYLAHRELRVYTVNTKKYYAEPTRRVVRELSKINKDFGLKLTP